MLDERGLGHEELFYRLHELVRPLQVHRVPRQREVVRERAPRERAAEEVRVLHREHGVLRAVQHHGGGSELEELVVLDAPGRGYLGAGGRGVPA
eukprot:217461-Pyramimonas_sp.AAC.1